MPRGGNLGSVFMSSWEGGVLIGLIRSEDQSDAGETQRKRNQNMEADWRYSSPVFRPMGIGICREVATVVGVFFIFVYGYRNRGGGGRGFGVEV